MTPGIIAQIRTWVPALVGAAATYLSTRGLDITPETQLLVASAGTAIATGLYHGLVTALAAKWPWFGALLGHKTAPVYPTKHRDDLRYRELPVTGQDEW